MLTFTRLVVVLAAATLAGCGGDGEEQQASTTSPAPATPTAIAGQDKLPEQPQVELDFGMAELADLVIDPAARGRIEAGGLELDLGEAGSARAAPREQPPEDTQTTLVIARVRDPQQLRGRAGIFCRGGRDDTGYELTLDRAGRVRLDRVAEDGRTTLARGQARLDAANPPDSPVPLFLVCGRGDESGPNVVFTVGAQEPAGVRDPAPLPPGSRAGMLVAGERGDRAAFSVLTLTYGP